MVGCGDLVLGMLDIGNPTCDRSVTHAILVENIHCGGAKHLEKKIGKLLNLSNS